MIKIKEITDLATAERLWRALSPRKTIFDEWDFRYCFYKYDIHPILFLAAYDSEKKNSTKDDKAKDKVDGRENDNKKDCHEHDAEEGDLIGLLPLQLHPKHGYEFFDEYNCEENRPFIKSGYENIIPDLYQAIPGKAKIYDISGEDEFTTKLEIEDYSYFLPLAGLENFNDFLQKRLSSKRRKSLLKEITEAENNNLEIEIFKGSYDEKSLGGLEKLFSFNTGNFGSESYLLKEDQAPWLDLLKLDFDWRFIVAKISGEIQGVALSILYNNDWHYLITGVNYKDFSGLGKLMVKVAIEAALKEGVSIFDAGLGDCGWKHLWHFDKLPQYIFTKES